jgi:hypothetical protein
MAVQRITDQTLQVSPEHKQIAASLKTALAAYDARVEAASAAADTSSLFGPEFAELCREEERRQRGLMIAALSDIPQGEVLLAEAVAYRETDREVADAQTAMDNASDADYPAARTRVTAACVAATEQVNKMMHWPFLDETIEQTTAEIAGANACAVVHAVAAVVAGAAGGCADAAGGATVVPGDLAPVVGAGVAGPAAAAVVCAPAGAVA